MLRFAAPHEGLVFPSRLLEAPLQSADPELNALLMRHAERAIALLPTTQSLATATRKLLLELLPAGDAAAPDVAARMGLSRRTMTRRLASEGTTYKELLEQARHDLALQYLSKSNLEIQQIAFLLGYSETTAFARAFKRWTDQTPFEFRKGERTGATH